MKVKYQKNVLWYSYFFRRFLENRQILLARLYWVILLACIIIQSYRLLILKEFLHTSIEFCLKMAFFIYWRWARNRDKKPVSFPYKIVEIIRFIHLFWVSFFHDLGKNPFSSKLNHPHNHNTLQKFEIANICVLHDHSEKNTHSIELSYHNLCSLNN